MEIALDFLAGVVALVAVTYLPWLIGDSITTEQDKDVKGFDKWGLGMLIMLATLFVSTLIYHIGKGVMYLITNFL